jgi:quinol monooxygenase YgiN
MTEDQIDTFYELEIADRMTDKLRSIAQQVIAANQAAEPGTLVYNVYISEDEKLLTFWETHANNDAMQFHSERFARGSFVGQILDRTQSARLCLYGAVSDAMKVWAKDHGFEVEYATRIAGFTR